MSTSDDRLRRISWSEFLTEYQPIANERDQTLGCKGYLMDRTGEDYERVNQAMQQNPATVWTCLEGEGESVRICSGYSLLNRRGYLITEQPFRITKEFIEVQLADDE